MAKEKENNVHMAEVSVKQKLSLNVIGSCKNPSLCLVSIVSGDRKLSIEWMLQKSLRNSMQKMCEQARPHTFSGFQT